VTEQQLGIYLKTPGRVDHRGSFDPDLILDAVIGYGLTDAPRGPTRELIAWMTEVPAPVISLDVPSGLDATTGDTPGDAVQAVTTLTLALPKTGLVSPLAGDLWLADLGIPSEVYATAGVQLSRAVFEGRHRIHLVRQTT
jgi:NAD(P)H-hydrate epimerase